MLYPPLPTIQYVQYHLHIIAVCRSKPILYPPILQINSRHDHLGRPVPDTKMCQLAVDIRRHKFAFRRRMREEIGRDHSIDIPESNNRRPVVYDVLQVCTIIFMNLFIYFSEQYFLFCRFEELNCAVCKYERFCSSGYSHKCESIWLKQDVSSVSFTSIL